jgi:dUTP pyrophosphatase
MTEKSIGCDLLARENYTVEPGKVLKVDTGVWIAKVDWEKVPSGLIPDIQVRARSGLAFKHGITLANGIGTIDADYPDEIGVLLLNTSDKPFIVEKGMRIAQLVLAYTGRFEELPVGGERSGGFGSTSV